MFLPASPDCARLDSFRHLALGTSAIRRKRRRAIPRESSPAAKCAAAKPSNPEPWIQCPTCDWPPSTINGIFPPSCARTCSAFVGEIAVGQIGAGRGQRKTAFADHRLNERMSRPADADRPAARRHNGGNYFRARQNQRQRAGPEGFGQFSGQFRPVCARSVRAISLPATWTMMGLCAGPAFDLENFGDGFFIQRVGGEAINRFRRQRHDFAGAQQFRRAADGFLKKLRRVRGKDFGLHRQMLTG